MEPRSSARTASSYAQSRLCNLHGHFCYCSQCCSREFFPFSLPLFKLGSSVFKLCGRIYLLGYFYHTSVTCVVWCAHGSVCTSCLPHLLSTLHLETGSLTGTHSSLICRIPLAILPQGALCLHLLCTGLPTHHRAHPEFMWLLRNRNTGPHSCEPSPRPPAMCPLVYYKLLFIPNSFFISKAFCVPAPPHLFPLCFSCLLRHSVKAALKSSSSKPVVSVIVVFPSAGCSFSFRLRCPEFWCNKGITVKTWRSSCYVETLGLA